jgi:hypothetical protein
MCRKTGTYWQHATRDHSTWLSADVADLVDLVAAGAMMAWMVVMEASPSIA